MVSEEKLFQIWEAGLDSPPLARSVAILRAAGTLRIGGDPATLPIGARDLEMLSLRELVFGSDLTGVTTCPQCREHVEIRLRTADLHLPAPAQPESLVCESGGYFINFRLPCSVDLLSVDVAGDEHEDGRRILERCVTEATLDGVAVAPASLPETVAEAIATAMAAADPQAEMELALECPTCMCHWVELFDIDGFFWTELQAWAARILREIHQLASAYGWSEREILSLPALRRNTYLNLISE